MVTVKQLFRRKTINQAVRDASDEGHGTGLQRSLTVWDLTSFGIAAVIGAGIFSTVGNAAFNGGPAVVWLFVVTAIVCGLSALCYAEFASQIPAAGSAYTYAYVSLGELVAWIIGWDLIMEYAIGNIAVAISWSEYFSGLLRGYGINIPTYFTMDFVTAMRGFNAGDPASIAYQAWQNAPRIGDLPIICNLPALAITVLVTSVAYVGIKESKWTSNAMVALKMLIILMVITVGAFYVQPHHWIPFMPNGLKGVFKGVSAVFFAYIGFDAISTTAEECKNPQRDLPRGMLYSLVICTILYVAIALVITGIVSYKELQVGDPLAFVFGPKGANVQWISSIVALSAVIAMASVMLVFQLGQPRIWMAMSRDGLLPKIFGRVHRVYKTPSFSTVMTGVMVAVPALFMNLTEVTDLTSIGTLFAFLLVCAGVIQLHEVRRSSGSKKRSKQVFQMPIVGSRVLAPLFFVGFVAMGWALNRQGVLHFFDLNASGVELTERIPTAAYILGMLWLTWKCIECDWSLLPCLGLASCGYLITELGWMNWVRFLVWLTLGLIIYFAHGRHQSRLAHDRK